MDALLLARLQFATTTSIHFLFVLVTLGLVTALAVMQTRATVGGNPLWERITRFWGVLYVINYVLGIATGIVMEFQFGLNWSGLTRVFGDVFGAPLAMETIIAFFAESTFLGMWIFGWGRLNRWVHLALIWLVAATAYLSAFWVLVANGFMQDPVGFTRDADGTARLSDFDAVLANPNVWYAFAHVVSAALATGGVLVVAVSAYHLLKRTDDDFFVRSLRLGWLLAFVGFFGGFSTGWPQYGHVVANQPMKGAGQGDDAPTVAEAQRQLVEQFGPGDYHVPDGIFTAFGVMTTIGELFAYVFLFGAVLLIRRWIVRRRIVLRLLVCLLPVPFVAAVAGWLFRELGRQPWVVYGELTTADAVSGIGANAMLASFIGFTVLLTALAVTNWWLLARYARRGPGDEFSPPEPEADDVPVPTLAVR